MTDGRDSQSLTMLLHAWNSGSGEAHDQGWNTVYDRLRPLAHPRPQGS